MKLMLLLSIIFLGSCKGIENNIEIEEPNEPETPSCVYEGSYSEEGANIKVAWNASSKPCVNSCGGGYKIYYKKRSVAADDLFIKDVMEISLNIKVFDVPYSSQIATAPNSAELNLSAGKWYVKVSSYCENLESDPSNAFVVDVE